MKNLKVKHPLHITFVRAVVIGKPIPQEPVDKEAKRKELKGERKRRKQNRV